MHLVAANRRRRLISLYSENATLQQKTPTNREARGC